MGTLNTAQGDDAWLERVVGLQFISKILIAAGTNGQLCTWRRLCALQAHEQRCNAMAWTGQRLVTIGSDRMKAWSVEAIATEENVTAMLDIPLSDATRLVSDKQQLIALLYPPGVEKPLSGRFSVSVWNVADIEGFKG